MKEGFYLTEVANLEPALNLATFFAAILISFPVCGFLPTLAFLLATDQVPKPISVTLSFFFNDLVMVPVI
jgi:hypothetical protein